MRKVTLLIAIGLLLTAGTSYSESEQPRRVLVLISSVDMGSWEQAYIFKLQGQLTSTTNSTRISLEFLGLDLLEDSEKKARAIQIGNRIQGHPFDLVMSILPQASQFLDDYGDEFARDLPRIYVLPNEEHAIKLDAEPDSQILHSAWPEAVDRTIQLMSGLIPQLQQIYIVAGSGGDDQNFLARTTKVIAGNDYPFQFVTLAGMSPEMLTQYFASHPERGGKEAILFVTHEDDELHTPHHSVEISKYLSETSSMPVFGMFNTLMDYGVVGGSMTNASAYAEKTASMVVNRLSETGLDSQQAPATEVIVDWLLLKRYKLDEDNLPPSATILNQEPDLWESYGRQIVTAIVIIGLQTLLIILLLYTRARRTIAERERDQSYSELLEQSQLFESVINGTQDAVVIADEHQKILLTNKLGVSQTFGEQDIAGKPVSVLFRGSEANLADLNLSEPTLTQFVRGDGESFTGEMIGGRLADSKNHPIGYFLFIRDVSLRLQQEQDLRQAQKMEALGGLAGGIAHDFNNLLTSIIGSTEMVLLDKNLSEESHTNLARILQASDQATSMVKKILTFSRKSDDSRQVPIDLSHLLDEVIDLFKATLPSNISLEYTNDASEAGLVGDETQIKQMILNICTNAQHAMKEGGALIISLNSAVIADEIKLARGSLTPGRFIKLSIEDTGTGIDPKTQDRIFDPFFTTKEPDEGTGMGLSLVYGVVEAHQGAIDFESKPGRGSRFDIYLKLNETNSKTTEISGKDEISRGHGETIALIDDNYSVLQTNVKLLEAIGYEVLPFQDPLDAIENLTKDISRVSLVITDQTMPRMQGSSVFKRIRELDRNLPVIIYSGYSELEDLGEDESLGFLKKPYSLAELSSLVQQMLLTRA